MAIKHLKIQNGITVIPVTADPTSPQNGDIIYRSDLNKFRKYENGAWSDLSGGGGGGTDFSDADFRIQDNSDATKEIAFQASGIATGTTRTITMPDTDINLGDIASAVAAANDAQADVDDVITLSGVPANSEDLGTFTGSVISDNATIKNALQELETAVEASGGVGAVTYKGTYNASTNTPTLANTNTGVQGFMYTVTVAGTRNFGAGSIVFTVGDKVVNNGTVWEKWDVVDPASANQALSNLTSPTAINQDLIPNTSSRNLGDASNIWNSVYVTTLRKGTNTLDLNSNIALGGVQKINWASSDIILYQTRLYRSDGVSNTNFISEIYKHNIVLSAGVVVPTQVNFVINFAGVRGMRIDYTISEDGTNKQRTGRLIFASNGTTVTMLEDKVETSALGNGSGLTFTAGQVGTEIRLYYNNTHATNTCTMRADIKIFSAT